MLPLEASRLPLLYFLHWKRGLVKLIRFARHSGSLNLWERPCGSTPTALASVTVAQQCSGRPTVSERRRSFGELLSARKCAGLVDYPALCEVLKTCRGIETLRAFCQLLSPGWLPPSLSGRPPGRPPGLLPGALVPPAASPSEAARLTLRHSHSGGRGNYLPETG